MSRSLLDYYRGRDAQAETLRNWAHNRAVSNWAGSGSSSTRRYPEKEPRENFGDSGTLHPKRGGA